MTAKKKQTWNEILKFIVTVLTAVLGTMGITSCNG